MLRRATRDEENQQPDAIEAVARRLQQQEADGAGRTAARRRSAPITPSHVLPGLISGASLCRPNAAGEVRGGVGDPDDRQKRQQQRTAILCSARARATSARARSSPTAPSTQRMRTRQPPHSQNGATTTQNTQREQRNSTMVGRFARARCATESRPTQRRQIARIRRVNHARAAPITGEPPHSQRAECSAGKQQQRPGQLRQKEQRRQRIRQQRRRRSARAVMSMDRERRSGRLALIGNRHRTHAADRRARGLDLRAARWCGRSGARAPGRRRSRRRALRRRNRARASSVK